MGELVYGSALGIVLIYDAHHASECGGYGCSSWADVDQWHIQLISPSPFPEPIPYKGALGLWEWKSPVLNPWTLRGML